MKYPLTKNTKENSPSGAHGTYIQITPKRGVKLMHGNYDTKEIAKNSENYMEAEEERNFLKHLEENNCNFVPKCYGITFVIVGGRYYVGLILQHLGSVHLADIPTSAMSYKEKQEIIDEFEFTLRNHYNIEHRDIHHSNVMCFEGRYWVIDFGSNLVSYC